MAQKNIVNVVEGLVVRFDYTHSRDNAKRARKNCSLRIERNEFRSIVMYVSNSSKARDLVFRLENGNIIELFIGHLKPDGKAGIRLKQPDLVILITAPEEQIPPLKEFMKLLKRIKDFPSKTFELQLPRSEDEAAEDGRSRKKKTKKSQENQDDNVENQDDNVENQENNPDAINIINDAPTKNAFTALRDNDNEFSDPESTHESEEEEENDEGQNEDDDDKEEILKDFVVADDDEAEEEKPHDSDQEEEEFIESARKAVKKQTSDEEVGEKRLTRIRRGKRQREDDTQKSNDVGESNEWGHKKMRIEAKF